MKKRYFFASILMCLYLTISGLLPVYADSLPQADIDAINNNWVNWVGNGASSCGLGDISLTGATNISNYIWNSGLQPPYILEQWAIETLKDVAQKMSVDSGSTVTQEHVIALVAFALGEGGDINNDDLFNPLNTGISDPALIAGMSASNGVQSFKSFDAGVEAAARTITGSNQTRLAGVLIRPDTSAQQFMYALTYYNKYPGNLFWAAASEPPNQDSYYRDRLQLVDQVRRDYADIAGLIIGTPAHEQILNLTDKSKLQYHPSGDQSSLSDNTTADISLASCGAGVVSGSIAQTAIGLSWPDPPSADKPARDPLVPTAAYAAAVLKFYPTAPFTGADCGAFVGIVMKASGADPNYPPVGTGIQQAYVEAHPEKYIIITNAQSTADLQPGDIAIINAGSGSGASGHTYIYVGPQAGGYNEASASMGDRMPSLDGTILQDYRGHYIVARLK